MQRTTRVAMITIALLASTPARAYAAEAGVDVPTWLPYASGLLSLLVALALLGAVLRLRRLVFGAAISAYTSYVVIAVACLVASVLVYWWDNIVPAVIAGQAVLASNLLVTAAMGLLVLYFTSVRRRLDMFARDLTAPATEAGESFEALESEGSPGA